MSISDARHAKRSPTTRALLVLRALGASCLTAKELETRTGLHRQAILRALDALRASGYEIEVSDTIVNRARAYSVKPPF